MSLSQEDKELVEFARSIIRENYDSVNWWHTVGAAVRTKNGKVYVGVNCDSVSHGACAEVIAIMAAGKGSETAWRRMRYGFGISKSNNTVN